MRNILFTTGLLLVMSQLFGQTEKASYKTVANKFEHFYNTSRYDSIYALFSDKMKEALPFDKLSDFLVDLQSQAGKITKRQFVTYKKSYASYKTNFERAMFDVLISIDDNADINGLFVK